MRTGRDVAVFVRRRGELLLLRHARHGYWHVVAGVVEQGESYLSAARRELQEETGLVPSTPLRRLNLVSRYPVGSHERAEYAEGLTEVTCESYVADAPDEWEPSLNEEHTAHEWAALSEAERMLHWPAAIEALHVLAVSAGSSVDEARELVDIINARDGSRWSLIRRIGAGSQQGAYELVDDRGSRAVLKWHTRHLPAPQLGETASLIALAQTRGWLTARWLTYGPLPAEGAYIIEEFITGDPLEAVDEMMLDQLLAANRLQAGLAPHAAHDWSVYAHRVVFEDRTGDLARLRSRQATAEFAERLGHLLRRARELQLPTGDLVHGDFTPRNVIVHDGAPYLVDAAHAGGGTRAYDLAVLAVDSHWVDPAARCRERVLREAHALVGRAALLVCLAARMIILLEWGGRHWPADVPNAVARCDELLALVPARA